MTTPRSSAGAPREAPQNPLHERYASREMARIFSAPHRFGCWRRIWVALAEAQKALGLEISDAQIAALKRAEPEIDLERVAELERRTELISLRPSIEGRMHMRWSVLITCQRGWELSRFA